MKRLAIYVLLGICALALAAACARVQAQQVSPVIQEFDKKARGTVQVTNISDAPKFVSCRAQGFDPDEHGAPHPHPLDAAMNVRIAAERVLMAPKMLTAGFFRCNSGCAASLVPGDMPVHARRTSEGNHGCHGGVVDRYRSWRAAGST